MKQKWSANDVLYGFGIFAMYFVAAFAGSFIGSLLIAWIKRG